MGGASSSLGGGNSYGRQVDLAKKLSDDILTLFFQNANLKKLLNLNKLEECPRFVFVTADELASQFSRLQVYPKLGKKGEIVFAPLTDLAPTATNKKDAQTQEKIHKRNELCVDIAYYYVRIFQIYSALALTVIDADPNRRRSVGMVRNPMRPQGTQNAPLTGGSRPTVGSGPLFVQLGGAVISPGSKFKNLYVSIIQTPFLALLSLQLLMPNTAVESKPEQILKLNDIRSGTKGAIYLRWDWPSKPVNEYEVDGVFKRSSVEKQVKVKMVMDGTNKCVFTYTDSEAGSTSQNFRKSVSGEWEFEYQVGEGGAKDPVTFFDNIYDLYDELDAKGAGSSSTGPSSSIGSSGSGTSGTSAFDGFDKLKKIFQDKAESGAEFPKAYCIARAMTLLNPVFSSELIDKNQPYRSQICKNTYDFESKDSHMPRAGASAKANLYIRSFVSLFYDDYKYNRSTQKLELAQTEPSRSELRAVSNQFAKLYNLPGDQSNFLLPEGGGSTQFTKFPVCEKAQDKVLQIKTDANGKKLVDELQKQCIKPMLDFQLAHTNKVNVLLKKMFVIENAVDANKRPYTRLRLNPTVKAQGRDGVNAIGREAQKVLLDYYTKSEAFFIRGVYMIGSATNAFDAL